MTEKTLTEEEVTAVAKEAAREAAIEAKVEGEREGLSKEEVKERAVEKVEAKIEASLYDGFVNEVVTRKYQEKRGDAVGRHATVWVTQPEPGSEAEKAVYAMGDPDVVQELGDALESKYDYHGCSPQPLSKGREAEVIRVEAVNLIRDMARRGYLPEAELKRIGRVIEEASPKELLETKEAIEETAKALDEFKQGGEENGKDK